ncbi:MAG: hypothetical protein LKF52_02050 [Butyrivibrio sp.]|nr:hypothetical protein [Butyrivibrio sp.]
MEYVLTPGFLALIIYVLYFMWISYGRALTANDDYKHWMLAVKNYYWYNDFSNIPIATDQYASYPPAVTLWNYFATKLWITCSVGMSLTAQNIFTVSLLLPLFKNVKSFKEWKKWLLYFAMVLVIPIAIGERAYQTLFVDTILGLVSSFILWNYYEYLLQKDRWHRNIILWSLFILGLVKEFGMVIGTTDLMILIAVDLFRKYQMKDSVKLLKENFSRILAFAAGVVSWYGYLGLSDRVYSGTYALVKLPLALMSVGIGKMGTFFMPVLGMAGMGHLSEMTNLFNADGLHGEGYSKEVALAVWNSIFSTDQFSVGYILPLSLYSFMLIISGICIVRIKSGHAEAERKHEYVYGNALIISTVLGTLFFCFALYLAYIALFPEVEARTAAVFARYISPCVFNMSVLTLVVFLHEQEGISRRLYPILAAVVLLFAGVSQPVSLTMNKTDEDVFWGIDDASVTLKAGDKVYFVDSLDKEKLHNYKARFYYRIMPAKSNYFDADVSAVYGNKENPVAAFSQILIEQGYNYVYLEDVDDKFSNIFGTMFENKSDIGNDRLYSISVDSANNAHLTLSHK